MSAVQHAKKRRLAAQKAERKAIEEQIALFTTNLITECETIVVPGVKSIHFHKEYIDEYIKAYSQANTQHLGCVYWYVHGPLVTAQLDNGNVLVRCANRYNSPSDFHTWTVFFAEGGSKDDIPPPHLEYLRAHVPKQYKFCRVLPSCKTTKDEETNATIIKFYEQCPHVIVKPLCTMLHRTALIREDELDMDGYYTIASVLRITYMGFQIPDPLIRKEKIIYEYKIDDSTKDAAFKLGTTLMDELHARVEKEPSS
jgi:hypothetical protein